MMPETEVFSHAPACGVLPLLRRPLSLRPAAPGRGVARRRAAQRKAG